MKELRFIVVESAYPDYQMESKIVYALVKSKSDVRTAINQILNSNTRMLSHTEYVKCDVLKVTIHPDDVNLYKSLTQVLKESSDK